MGESQGIYDGLDARDPSWSHRVSLITMLDRGVAVAVSLTLGGVTRGGIGFASPDEGGLHLAERKAIEEAVLKFPGSRAGLAAHAAPGRPSPGPFSGDARARAVADAVTPKQLDEVRTLCRSLGLDPEREAAARYKVRLEEMSKSAASHFVLSLNDELSVPAWGPPPQGVVKSEEFRDKRGRAIAALPGAVVKDGARYVVTIRAAGGGPDLPFHVTRGDDGRPRCTCPDFERHKSQAGYRCEHVFAVLHFTSNKSAGAPGPARSQERET